MQRFGKRRYVVTGGSSGIGLEVAKRLVAEGGEVCLAARGAERLEGACREIGAGAFPVTADLAERDGAERIVEEVGARWDALDGLVNNAGVAPMASLLDTDAVTWRHCFAVNVEGPFHLLRLAHRLLEGSGNASVVNISSTLAVKAIPGMAAYNASKAALNQLTRSVALEWAPAVRVNAVMPAVVDTPIHASRGMSAGDVAAMGGIHPLGRVGTVGDVAALVTFLLSDEAAWMTGAVIPVDGGMTAT